MYKDLTIFYEVQKTEPPKKDVENSSLSIVLFLHKKWCGALVKNIDHWVLSPEIFLSET